MPDTQSLISRYSSLKSQKESLERSLLEKETEYKTLKSQYEALLKETCVKYNVHTLEELETLLSSETVALDSLLKTAESSLAILSPSSTLSVDL